MNLRTSGEPPGSAAPTHRRLKLLALFVGAVLLLPTALTGSSSAGISNYQGTLYLDGPTATVTTTSFGLLTSAGPSAPPAPILAVGAAGTGTLAAGNYLYIAVAQSGGANTAGPSAQATGVPLNGSVTVSNVTVGSLVYRLFLGATGATSYTLVSPSAGITAAPFLDTGGSSATVLPQADNRAATGALGYADFAPGTVFSTASAATPALAGAISTPSVCTGWLVDAAGGLTLPAGAWTFQARIKSGAAGALNAAAVARLTVALYVVNAAGAPTATLIPPTDGTGNLINTGGMTNTFTVSATTTSSTVLGTSDHLCVQFWRHQTAGYASGGGSKSTLTLLGYDALNAVTLHPTPNAFADVPALSSPADNLHTTSVPTLSSTYSDPDADPGTLTIKLCTDAGCSSSPQNSGALAATNGATLAWAPAGPLADGQYWWRAQGNDGLGQPSAWSAARTFFIDNVAPVTSIGPTMPPANTPSSNPTFDLASNESGSTFECRLDAAAFAGCTTPMSYTGVANGTHTFDLRATDAAGNLDTSPASYTWRIDNVAPSTPSLTAPADAVATNSLPQLRATFNDASAGGDTGSVEFQICSASAPAGTACAPVVQSAASGSVSSGGTASVTPSALADGTYYWQSRAQDVAGNQSSWSATRSFQFDATPPAVPSLGAPADDEWVRSAQLTATFSKPSGAGTIEFRICSDPLCTGVVRTGSSGSLVSGASGDWSPSSAPGDGLWYWQARAHDTYANASAWSSSRAFHLDTVAPGKPLDFNGQIGADGLTLRWSAPSDTIANYVVYINGAPWMNLGSTEFEFKAGPFDAGDPRTFSVVGVDRAGNVGAMSAVLVGVPNLVGLTWPEAFSETSARGLGLRRNVVVFSAVPVVVTGQDPAAAALAEKGTAVLVTMTPAPGAPLGLRVRPGRVVCARGSVLRLRVELSASAVVGRRLLNAHGRVLGRGMVGQLQAGTNNVRFKLPRALHRGWGYRLMLDATGEGGTAHAGVRIKVGTRACRAR